MVNFLVMRKQQYEVSSEAGASGQSADKRNTALVDGAIFCKNNFFEILTSFWLP